MPPLLWPLMLPYGAGIRLKNLAYDRGWLEPKRLAWPVISVGNLSVGGTGKTPTVLFLADRLKALGWNADVLSRGYGRSSREVARVDPSGTPEQFGDEPLLMARRGVSVYVGGDRYLPGRLAESDAKADPDSIRSVHILDDGFQHRRLARMIDIVLLQSADLEDHLLPAGRLRESIRGLGRADICVLRAEDSDLTDRVLPLMRTSNPGLDPARVWIVERRTILPVASAAIAKAVAFCALGDATGFFQGLRHAGVEPQATIAFRDHHIYTGKDIERLLAAARRFGAQCFLTTEKDIVRLSDAFRAELEQQCPLIPAGLQISLREETRSMEMLEALLRRGLQVPPNNVR